MYFTVGIPQKFYIHIQNSNVVLLQTFKHELAKSVKNLNLLLTRAFVSKNAPIHWRQRER